MDVINAHHFEGRAGALWQPDLMVRSKPLKKPAKPDKIGDEKDDEDSENQFADGSFFHDFRAFPETKNTVMRLRKMTVASESAKLCSNRPATSGFLLNLIGIQGVSLTQRLG
jgi:hypothetical protein